eukprot:COSAG03_NODE_1727_length_3598_cov_38.954558_4_plen_54_part_00
MLSRTMDVYIIRQWISRCDSSMALLTSHTASVVTPSASATSRKNTNIVSTHFM